jgi:membrane-bound serine protease (ClpP class)
VIAVIIILICLGLLFLGIEFIVPGGVIGVIGGICMFAAVVVTFLEHGPMMGFIMGLFAVAVSLTSLVLWMKYFHKSRVGKAFMLESEVKGTAAFQEKQHLLGKKGVARNDLHPTGTAVIEGQKVDVVAETGLIDKGAAVEVVKVQGMTVFVRKMDAGNTGKGLDDKNA